MINAFLKGGRYSKGDFRQYFSQSGIDTKKVMMGFKKYRDQPVNTILDLDYLEWAVDKTKNRYLKIAILERITELKAERRCESQIFTYVPDWQI